MADMYAIFGTLIALGITYPGMLTAWWLLFPENVERARQRIAKTPCKSFGFGVAAAILAAIPGVVFFTLPSQFTQVLGWIWLVIVLGLASLGAAGIAAEIGDRLNQRNEVEFTALGAFLRGAVIWELASAFPIIGWLLVIPVGLFISLGGASFAVLRWAPKSKTEIKDA
jgi:fatty acid desaturase